MENKTLVVENLSKKYGSNTEYAIKNINFSVSEGSFHGFIGANGSGKTTTIKSIIGAYTNFEGNINICSINSRLPESRKNISYVPEVAVFPDNISVKNYIIQMCWLFGLKGESAKKQLAEVVELTQINELINKKPSKLSSGQKKKILLAQALINSPKIIVLDEPTANLDPVAKDEMYKILTTLNKAGTTIFISSHSLEELDKYVDEVTLLSKGECVYSGPKINYLGNDRLEFELEIQNSEKNELARKLLKDKVESIIETSKTHFTVVVTNRETKDLMLKILAESGIFPDSMKELSANLNSLFRSKTDK